MTPYVSSDSEGATLTRLELSCLAPKLTTMCYAISRPRLKSLVCPPALQPCTGIFLSPTLISETGTVFRRFPDYCRNSTMLAIHHCVSLHLPLGSREVPDVSRERDMLSHTGLVGTTQRQVRNLPLPFLFSSSFLVSSGIRTLYSAQGLQGSPLSLCYMLTEHFVGTTQLL